MLRIIMSALTIPVTVAISSAAVLFASLAYGLGLLNIASHDSIER